MIQQFVRTIGLFIFIGAVSVIAINAQSADSKPACSGPALATVSPGGEKVSFDQKELDKEYAAYTSQAKKERGAKVQSKEAFRDELAGEIQKSARKVFPGGKDPEFLRVVITIKFRNITITITIE
jgi:hypothetical protein